MDAPEAGLRDGEALESERVRVCDPAIRGHRRAGSDLPDATERGAAFAAAERGNVAARLPQFRDRSGRSQVRRLPLFRRHPFVSFRTYTLRGCVPAERRFSTIT